MDTAFRPAQGGVWSWGGGRDGFPGDMGHGMVLPKATRFAAAGRCPKVSKTPFGNLTCPRGFQSHFVETDRLVAGQDLVNAPPENFLRETVLTVILLTTPLFFFYLKGNCFP